MKTKTMPRIGPDGAWRRDDGTALYCVTVLGVTRVLVWAKTEDDAWVEFLALRFSMRTGSDSARLTPPSRDECAIRFADDSELAETLTGRRRRKSSPSNTLPLFDATQVTKETKMVTTNDTTQRDPVLDAQLKGLIPGPQDLTTPGKVGNVHPATSHQAAQLVAPRAQSQRGKILAFALTRPEGFIAAEAADVIGRSRNQTATRMLELRERGWLRRLTSDGKYVTRTTEGENEAIVHVLTEEGRAALG